MMVVMPMMICNRNEDNPKVCLLHHLEATNQTIKGRLAALTFPCIAEFFNQVSLFSTTIIKTVIKMIKTTRPVSLATSSSILGDSLPGGEDRKSWQF